jgi:hypothetical protein
MSSLVLLFAPKVLQGVRQLINEVFGLGNGIVLLNALHRFGGQP